MEALERLGVKITPTIETMIEAAVKEMDIQNDKIKDEFKRIEGVMKWVLLHTL